MDVPSNAHGSSTVVGADYTSTPFQTLQPTQHRTEFWSAWRPGFHTKPAKHQETMRERAASPKALNSERLS